MKAFVYMLFMVLILAIAECEPRKPRYNPLYCMDKAPRYCKSTVKENGCRGMVGRWACAQTCEHCENSLQ
ncbi:unnamed protein product [Cylicocyclus nassatus]|uniref:Uncharacterized protein n=1 Tax=Cylicocyclus nassatus TaxID=53992 RepID=A0AA36DQD1_CYLNA|nr:unnamed protein product [Cylicocyclus nassatus]